MREKDIELSACFDHQVAVQSLVAETFGESQQLPEGAGQPNEIYQPNGRLNSHALIRNAKILLAAGDIALAKNVFRALIEHGELLGVAYSGLGSCYDLEGKVDLAIKAFREAIIYEPTYGSLFALAELYIKKEEYTNAIGTLLRASNVNRVTGEQSFEIHKSLGNCYMHLSQLNNAESHYRKAYDIRPDSDLLHVNIGSLAMKKGDLATALLHFKESIRINPKNASGHTGVGLTLLGLGNPVAAHDSFISALDADIREITALYHLVKCAYELKQYEPACELLKRYIQSSPVNSNILYSYAGVLYHCNKFKESLEECEKLIALKPDHPGALKLKELVSKKLA